MKDIQQLIKKNSQEGRYEDIFPKTFLDAVIDKESGTTLTDILSSFNMYFLSYSGSRETTRLEVPMSLRKQGLWITYVLYDGNTITEWYGINAVDDVSWQDGNNWRLGSNMLVGDISISADGNWIVNGVDTGIPANPASVVQDLGNSETAVMSQAGVTSALNSNFKRFRGDTLNRPILTTDDAGYPYYDTTIGKYIVWNGGSWVNLDGTSLG